MRGIIFNLKATAAGLLLLSLLVAGCLPAPVRVADDAGVAPALDRPVDKIISLAPSNTEMVYYFGLQNRLAGVTEYCNYPAEAMQKPHVGGFSTVDLEKVVSLQPDLVLAADIHSKSTTPMLEKLGFHVVTFKPKTMDNVIGDLRLLARLCGMAEPAAGKIADLTGRINAVTAKTQGLTEDKKPKVLIVIWHDPLRAAGTATLADDIVRLAGGTNVAGNISGYANFSIESVLSAGPQVIIIPSSMGDSGSQIWNSIVQDSRLKEVPALKHNAVYKIDGDVLLRYGPRSIAALEQVAVLLHPDLFSQ
jgi:iron complex transport system substrate-binding protein